MDLSFMQNEIVLALCWTLIHSLWQGLLLATLTGGVMIGTRKSSAGKRYRLLTGLFFVFMAVTVITFVKEYRTISHTNLTTQVTPIVNPNESYLSAIEVGETNVLVNKSIIERFKDYFNANASLIVLIWFVIFIARFIRLTANLAYVHRLKHYKTFAPPADWTERLNELVKTLGLTQKIKLLESGVVKMPVVMGVLKPVVLLPLGLLAHLPADEIEAILLHELAHIKRRDYLVNLLQNFAETIFFFNPALMWLSSMIREERENCCDDIAISVTNSKSRFINALISFQEYNFGSSPYTVGFAGRKNQLLNRVKRIMNEKNKTLNAAEKSVLTFGMGIFILFSFAAAKKIAPPAIKDVLSAIESGKKQNEATAKTGASILLQPQLVMHENTIAIEKGFSYQPAIHMRFDTSSIKTYEITLANGETLSYYDLSDTLIKGKADTTAKKTGLYDSKGYATYGEVVRYEDLVSDTIPSRGKQVPPKSSNRSVFGEETRADGSAYSLMADSISNRFTNITSNFNNDDVTVSATDKNGTEYKFRKVGGVVKEFYINGKQFTDIDTYTSVIKDIERALEYRRQKSKDRQALSAIRREQMALDKMKGAELRKEQSKDRQLKSLDRLEKLNELKEETIHLRNLEIDSARQDNKKQLHLRTKRDDSGRSFRKDGPLEIKLDMKTKLDAKASADVKTEIKNKFELQSRLNADYSASTSAQVRKETSRRLLARSSDSLRRLAANRETELAIRKQASMRLREIEDQSRMRTQSQKLKNIIADLEKEGVKIDLEKSWLALDKGQFIVDGKTMTKELHEKFIAKYVTSSEGWGYYYGPIQVRGRGIFMDYRDIAK